MLRSSTAMRLAFAAISAVVLLAACSPIKSLAALSRSADHFLPFAGDDRIRIEAGAEPFAAAISPYVADAIAKVESGHYAPFSAPATIYVCETKDSYYRLTGQRTPAVVTNKLFLSPDLFQDQKPVDRYLAHELSHLHLIQGLGPLGSVRLPSWFKEGLAELVSGGATGSSVALTEAYVAINSKHRFYPDEGRNIISSFFSPRYGSYWNIENRMFYRQSMLFVEFMRDYDHDAFRRFLVAVEGGTKFKKAFRTAYGCELTILWGKFLEKARVIERSGT